MKSKRMIVVAVSSIVLCLSLFFIFQNETDTSTSNKDLTLIYEEKGFKRSEISAEVF